MLLFKNKNGIVMAADTRCTKVGNPTLVNDNSRKIAYDANAKICISMVGVSSYDTRCSTKTFYLQPFLQDFITKNIDNRFKQLQARNIKLYQFIFAFLNALITHNCLLVSELQDFNTDLTAIILHNDNTAESIDVNIAKICPIVQNQNISQIINQPPGLCKCTTYVQTDTEVITGGDHLLSMVSGKGDIPPLNFINDYKLAIANCTLSELKHLAKGTIKALIKRNNDPFVGLTIGGHVDYIKMDYTGYYHPCIKSSNQAFQNLLNKVKSPSDWHIL
jgi:hypothetical protein